MLISKNIKLLKISSKIYSAVVYSDYDRAMLFCRAQEFYESPNTRFRGKNFSIWKYIEWYSSNNNNCFTYPKDWTGFNIPIGVLKKCYNLCEIESPYDSIMLKIISKIKDNDSYLIGVKKYGDKVFKHELCHALYATNKEYRRIADAITKSISKYNIKIIQKNLYDLGYSKNVIKDEIQAYFLIDFNYFNKNLLKKDLLLIHNKYKKNLYKFLKF